VITGDGPLGVYFLDVGQGDCTFIVAPGRAAVVMADCNDAFVARRLLEDHRIERIDAVVVTHLDLDHLRGVLPLLKGWVESGRALGSIFVGRDRFGASVGGHAEQLLRYAMELSDTPGGPTLQAPSREARAKCIVAGPGWSVDVVAPSYGAALAAQVDEDDEPNTLSAIVRVERAGTSVLIGGDATRRSGAGSV
jgi:beta-lactamase superfamily II metal-dependent hydrolase